MDTGKALHETGRRYPGLLRTALSRLPSALRKLKRLVAGRSRIPAPEYAEVAEDLLSEPLFSVYSSKPGGQLRDWPTTWQTVRPNAVLAAQADKNGAPAMHPDLSALPTEEHVRLLESLLRGDLPPLDSLPQDLRAVPPQLPAEASAALADTGRSLLSASTALTTKAKQRG